MKILLLGNKGMIGSKIESRINVLTHKPNLILPIEIDEPIDMIINTVSCTNVRDSINNPGKIIQEAMLQSNILEFMRSKGIKRYVYLSSRAVYGNTTKRNREDVVQLERCDSIYSASKLMNEAMIYSYHNKFGLDYLIFRPTNVYGDGDTVKRGRMFPMLIDKAIKGEDITITDGNHFIDFVSLEDVVDCIVSSIPKFNNVKNNTFNLGSGVSYTIKDVVDKIIKYTNSKSKVDYITTDNPQTGDCFCDIRQAKELLNYNPQTNIDDGIKQMVKR